MCTGRLRWGGRSCPLHERRLWARRELKPNGQMNRHGLRQARSRSLATVKIQVLAHVITLNIKRGAQLMQIRATGAPTVGLAIAGGAKQGDCGTAKIANNPP